jgi:hypothetical protein
MLFKSMHISSSSSLTVWLSDEALSQIADERMAAMTAGESQGRPVSPPD